MTQTREKYVEHCFWKGMKPFPAQARSDFVTFLLRQNSTIDNQLFARRIR